MPHEPTPGDKPTEPTSHEPNVYEQLLAQKHEKTVTEANAAAEAERSRIEREPAEKGYELIKRINETLSKLYDMVPKQTKNGEELSEVLKKINDRLEGEGDVEVLADDSGVTEGLDVHLDGLDAIIDDMQDKYITLNFAHSEQSIIADQTPISLKGRLEYKNEPEKGGTRYGLYSVEGQRIFSFQAAASKDADKPFVVRDSIRNELVPPGSQKYNEFLGVLASVDERLQAGVK